MLAGRDGPGRRALPAGELLHPAPLAALIVLGVNDHVLKGSAVPGWLTGKLSDFAGMLAFPLVVTAALDVALWCAARLGARVDFSLGRGRLALACAATAALLSAIKLSAGAAGAVARALSAIGFPSAIAADPTDLVALPAIALAWWLGRREIARVPLGRLEVIERRVRADGPADPADAEAEVARRLADAVACGADRDAVAGLARGFADYLGGGDPEPAERALARLRG